MSAPAHVRALRTRLSCADERGLLTAPGCWDGLTALLIERAGFEAAFLSGGGLAMSRLGRPDVGLTTASELEDAVAVIRDRVDLPLFVDADTGFGGPLNASRTTRRLERAGASALQIEDQVFPKRCGHMPGKSVAPLAEALDRLKAVLDARRSALVVARTDALAVEGLEAALDRGEAFLEAGADLLFVEGPRTRDELEAVARRFAGRAPLVHNLVEGGVTPTRSGPELERLGFAVALHPLVLLHGLARLAPELLEVLRRERSTEAIKDRLVDLQHMNSLTGAEKPNGRGSGSTPAQGR